MTCGRAVFRLVLTVALALAGFSCSRVKEALDQEEMKEWKDFVEQADLDVSLGETTDIDPGCGRPGGGKVIAYFRPPRTIVVNGNFIAGRSIEELKELIVHEAQHAKNDRLRPRLSPFEDEYRARLAECEIWRKVKKPGQHGVSDKVCDQLFQKDGHPRAKEDVKRLLEDLCYDFRDFRRREWREEDVVQLSLPGVGVSFPYPGFLSLEGEQASAGTSGASVLLYGMDSATGAGRTRLEVSSAPVDGKTDQTLAEIGEARISSRSQPGGVILAKRELDWLGVKAVEVGMRFPQARPDRSTGSYQVQAEWWFTFARLGDRLVEVLLFTTAVDAAQDLKAYEILRRSRPYAGTKATAEVASLGLAFDLPVGWGLSPVFQHEDVAQGRGIRLIGPVESGSGAGHSSVYITVLPMSEDGADGQVLRARASRGFAGVELEEGADATLLGSAATGDTLVFPTERPAKAVSPVLVPTSWRFDAVARDRNLVELHAIASVSDRGKAADAFAAIRESLRPIGK